MREPTTARCPRRILRFVRPTRLRSDRTDPCAEGRWCGSSCPGTSTSPSPSQRPGALPGRGHRPPPQHLSIDMTGVDFLSSTGLRAVVNTNHNRRGVLGWLHLLGDRTNRRVWRVTGLAGRRHSGDEQACADTRRSARTARPTRQLTYLCRRGHRGRVRHRARHRPRRLVHRRAAARRRPQPVPVHGPLRCRPRDHQRVSTSTSHSGRSWIGAFRVMT